MDSDLKGLPFWYCDDCKSNLDFRDPSMNIPLLKYLNGASIGGLIEEFGNVVFDRVFAQGI